MNEILHHQTLAYIQAIIWTQLIKKHHYDLVVGYFRIKKTKELIAQKFYRKPYDIKLKFISKGMTCV